MTDNILKIDECYGGHIYYGIVSKGKKAHIELITDKLHWADGEGNEHEVGFSNMDDLKSFVENSDDPCMKKHDSLHINYPEEVLEIKDQLKEMSVEDAIDTLARVWCVPDRRRYISVKCGESIVAGVEVETSKGIRHFGTSLEDQVNLLLFKVLELEKLLKGQSPTWVVSEGVPYHADSMGSEVYSTEDFEKISDTVFGHVLGHLTYANLLKDYIKNDASLEHLMEGIPYGEQLTENRQVELKNMVPVEVKSLKAIQTRVIQEKQEKMMKNKTGGTS